MKHRLKFTIKKLFRMALLLLGVSLTAFLLMDASPLDPLQTNIGQAALGAMSPEQSTRLENYWGVDTPAAERYLTLVRERTDHLAELTDSFFRYSMGRSPEAPGPVGDVCLNRALEESLAAWYAVLTRRGITPEVSMPERQVVRRLDSAALSRIFGNILSNAVKYSAGDLRAALTEDGVVTFTNSAPGITPILAEKLFDRYFTVETGQGSTGLGLAIARHLAEEMGGAVTASCEDEILCVRVRFP